MSSALPQVNETDARELEAAFKALGPVAVRRALSDEGRMHSWDSCFLALCYGRPGELTKDFQNRHEDPEFAIMRRFPRITEHQLALVVGYWDSMVAHYAFRDLAEDWLRRQEATTAEASRLVKETTDEVERLVKETAVSSELTPA